MRAKLVVDSEGRIYGYRINCPGCAAAGQHSAHVIPTGEHIATRWVFNGDVQRPTFSPSLHGEWEWGEQRVRSVCHSFIRDGRIEFLNDCTHPLAGQTVDLHEIQASSEA